MPLLYVGLENEYVYIYMYIHLAILGCTCIYIYITICNTCILQQIADSCSPNHANEHSDCSLASLVLLSPPIAKVSQCWWVDVRNILRRRRNI